MQSYFTALYGVRYSLLILLTLDDMITDTVTDRPVILIHTQLLYN